MPKKRIANGESRMAKSERRKANGEKRIANSRSQRRTMQTIATRAAEAMLRALGGSTILLRVPSGAGAAPSQPGLGLNAPVTDDISIAPAILRDATRVAG